MTYQLKFVTYLVAFDVKFSGKALEDSLSYANIFLRILFGGLDFELWEFEQLDF
jgi:hypothetical protein